VLATAAAYFFKYDSTATAAEQTTVAPRVVRPDDYAGSGNWEEYVPAGADSVLVQVQHEVVTAVVSGTTILPLDDTIPQNTEGVEVITCAITPKSATNILLIIANINSGSAIESAYYFGAALFQDTTANALAAVTGYGGVATGPLTIVYKMVAGTIIETTFKVRIGMPVSGTIYLNVGGAATRKFGGVAATTLTIFEYTP
jgi:hypothetical protein